MKERLFSVRPIAEDAFPFVAQHSLFMANVSDVTNTISLALSFSMDLIPLPKKSTS